MAELILLVLFPVKLTVWIVGLLCGNIWDGFIRGWHVVKPFGDAD
jgi:hypothetical protein